MERSASERQPPDDVVEKFIARRDLRRELKARPDDLYAPLDGDQLKASMQRILDWGGSQRRRVRFLGVYPLEKVPSAIIRPHEQSHEDACEDLCLIVNTEPSERAGQHWLAVYVPYIALHNINSSGVTELCATHPASANSKFDRDHSRLCVEFFDSFAQPSTAYNLSLSELPTVCLHENPHALQTAQSTFCGQYCLFLLAIRAFSDLSISSICAKLLKLYPTEKDREHYVVSDLTRMRAFYEPSRCFLPFRL